MKDRLDWKNLRDACRGYDGVVRIGPISTQQSQSSVASKIICSFRYTLNMFVLRIFIANANEQDFQCILCTMTASYDLVMYLLDMYRTNCGDTHKEFGSMPTRLRKHSGHNAIRESVGMYHPNNGWILTICNDHLFHLLRHSSWSHIGPKASINAISESNLRPFVRACSRCGVLPTLFHIACYTDARVWRLDSES